MGGTRWPGINLPSNLLTLCGSGTTGCHGWVEHHPKAAQAHGWSVARYQPDPQSVPVWTWRGWVCLLSDGRLIELGEGHHGISGYGTGCTCGCQPLTTTSGVWDTPMGDRARD